MTRREKLYEKALNNPKDLSFDELCRLAEYAGFGFKRQKGSHRIYKHPEIPGIEQTINIQEWKNGEAKPTQVRNLLDLIDKYRLI